MDAEAWTLVGWDAAVDPRNNALLRAQFHPSARDEPARLVIDPPLRPGSAEELREGLAEALTASPDTAVLLCLDAPVGWPVALGRELRTHRAGRALGADAGRLFRRATDHDVRIRLGKTPLDIGADRIARTTRSALETLAAVERQLGRRIEPVVGLSSTANASGGSPLAPADLLVMDGDACVPAPRAGAIPLIESYPAGWFASEGIRTSGYRPPAARVQRAELLSRLLQRLHAHGVHTRYSREETEAALCARADDLDALVCTLNGVDLVCGRVAPPPEALRNLVVVEGWIWVKDRRGG